MSDYTFNAPPNWPKPPVGWKPPTGWQPDPSWGAVPEGWQLWLPTAAASPAVPQQPVYQAPQYTPQPAPVASQQPVYNQQPQFGAPQQFQPAPRKKSRAGIIVAAIATVVIGALIAGGFYLFNVVLVVPDFDGEQTYESASTVEEAKVILQNEYDKVSAYIDNAPGGIYYDILHDSIDDTLASGLAETTISGVEMYTDTLGYTVESIDEDVANWEAVWVDKELNPENETGSIQEEILDRISGGFVDVSIDSHCEATACVDRDDPTRVHVITDALDSPTLIWEDVMRHEYAHVIQFKYLDKLEYGSDYETLFGSDPELHADCMSIAVKPDFITPYGSVCTPEMVESAGNVWEGIIK